METIHTGAAAITFPTTPEAFIAYQEQLAGRKLTEHEREVTAAWVEVFNLSYEGGLEQDRAALEDSLAKMDEPATKRDNGPVVRNFLRKCRLWIAIREPLSGDSRQITRAAGRYGQNSSFPISQGLPLAGASRAVSGHGKVLCSSHSAAAVAAAVKNPRI